MKVEPENHELVTVFFADIVSYTDMCSKLPAYKVIHGSSTSYMELKPVHLLYQKYLSSRPKAPTTHTNRQVSDMLNRLYTVFDELTAR